MNKTKLSTYASIAVLGLLTAALGCADLSVDNPNEPSRELALQSAGDIESLISASYHTWWNAAGGRYASATFFLSAATFQHSPWPANAGAVKYSKFPRIPIYNNQVGEYYPQMAQLYEESYSALSAVASGLSAIKSDTAVSNALRRDSALVRAQAFSKFMQGLGHASVALLYDQGYIIDENVPREVRQDASRAAEELEPVAYDSLMSRAMAYFDSAIALSEGANFTIPASWMSRSVTASTLAELSHTLKARFMAKVARSPQERADVDWQQVMAELNAGLDEFTMDLNAYSYTYNEFETDVINYWTFAGWQQANYFILGMADTAGNYQEWLDQPVTERRPNIDGEPVLIQTPDTRFPQGNTVEEQVANPGEYFAVPDTLSPYPADFPLSSSWQQPGRGTWRWSYYFDRRPGYHLYLSASSYPMIPEAETRLLRAEAHLRMGNPGQAASLINVSRTAHGLNQTDASGANTSCVPRLPDGTCTNDLMELLKWEKRLETQYRGMMMVPWYFDGRGWGELYAGTPVQFPMPAEDASLLNIQPYTFGGVGQEGGAPNSIYAWPGENGGS